MIVIFLSGCTQMVTAPIAATGALIGATVDITGAVVGVTVDATTATAGAIAGYYDDEY